MAWQGISLVYQNSYGLLPWLAFVLVVTRESSVAEGIGNDCFSQEDLTSSFAPI